MSDTWTSKNMVDAMTNKVTEAQGKTTFGPKFFEDVGRDPKKWVAGLRTRLGADAATDDVLEDFFAAALSLKEADAVEDALADDVSLLRTGLKIAKTTEKSLRQQLAAALAALAAPVSTQAEAKEAGIALADIVRAWEALPGGQQQPMRAVEKWLADEMAPSINRIRALLTEGEAR